MMEETEMNIFKVTSVCEIIKWFMLGGYITTFVINEIWESFLKKLIKSDIYSDAGLIKNTRSKNRLLGLIIFVLYLVVFQVINGLIDCTNIVDSCSNIKILKNIINDTSDVVFLFIWIGQIFGYIINSIWYRFSGKLLMSQFDIGTDCKYNELRRRQTNLFTILELVITIITFIFIGINETIDYSKFVG
jgi:hypothetical protein